MSYFSRSTLIGLFGLLLWLTGIQPSFAHASLLSTFPVDGAVLPEAPAQVRLNFNESVQITQLQVVDAGGQSLELKNLFATGDMPQADLPEGIPEGIYIVSWRAISADSHPVSGSFVFQVGESDAQALQAVMAARTQARDPLYWPLLVVRWGIYLGSLFVVGVLGWWRVLRGRLEFEAGSWVFTAVWLTLSLTVVAFCLHMAQLYPRFAGAELLTVLGSPYGWGIELRLLGLGILIWACEGGAGWVRSLGSVLVIGSFLPIGHALTSEYPLGTMVLLGLHLAGSAFWLGGLWGLDQLLSRESASEFTNVIRRFSDLATWVVPGLILAGVGMGGIHRGWHWEHPYGQYLWAKLLLVLMIMGLGAHNKFRLVPALQEGSRAVQQSLRKIVRLELAGLILVLALTSFLVAQAPPSHAVGSAVESSCEEGLNWPEGSLHIRVLPCRPGENWIQVEVEGIPAQELTLGFSLPEQGIPPLRRTALPDESGGFELQSVPLTLPGEWQIELALLISDFEERRGQVRFTLSP